MRHKSKDSVLESLGVQSELSEASVEPELPKDHEAKDEILKTALIWCEKNVHYVPLDIEGDINASYHNDSLEEFRRIVRGWLEELAAAEKKRGAAA